MFAPSDPGPGQVHLAFGEYFTTCRQCPDGGFFGGTHGRTELPGAVIDFLAGIGAVVRVPDGRSRRCGGSGLGLARDGGDTGSDGTFGRRARLRRNGADPVRAELDLGHTVHWPVEDNGGRVAPADGRTHAGRSATCCRDRKDQE